MKYLLIFLALTLSSTTFAQHSHRWHHGHHHHRHWHNNNHSWVFPAIIGGAVIYSASRPAPIVIQQPTVVLQPNQVIIDGFLYTKQTIILNGVETEVFIKVN
jgi:hypothetical protein